MEAEQSETSPNDETNQEYRVQVTTKKKVTELINRFKEVLTSALDGQPDISEETKRNLLQDLQDCKNQAPYVVCLEADKSIYICTCPQNFEAAVQANVLVNGQTWEEAPDVEEETTDLEILLDDTIVETTSKRSTYPKKILPHVVHGLKAERKIMGLYEQTVKPEEFVKDADQESIMREVSAAAPGVVRQAIQVIKSIHTLQKQAEGLCEVLHMKPSSASLQIHREVLGVSSQSDATVKQPIKRAVEETVTSEGYRVKKSKSIVGEDRHFLLHKN